MTMTQAAPRVSVDESSTVVVRSRVVNDSYELVVSGRTDLADGIVGIDLVAPNGDPLPWWDPGAHLDVTTPDGCVRQYSMCGDFGVSKSWRIGVLWDPDSRGGSESLHAHAAVGDHLVVGVPRNNFTFVPSERYLFLAGGIGITPLLSMMRAAEDRKSVV